MINRRKKGVEWFLYIKNVNNRKVINMAKGPLLLISVTKYKQKQTYEISIPTENISQISTVVGKHCRCFRLKYQNSILTSSSLRTTVNWRTNKLNLLFLFFVHDLLLFFHGSSDLLGAGGLALYKAALSWPSELSHTARSPCLCGDGSPDAAAAAVVSATSCYTVDTEWAPCLWSCKTVITST